ncbi:MAG: DUF3307 domain-containing protein, partial [Chloroflexi bacterium]|nr:DUF3307 domain-containing protein [Chloroflexota bacterium]
MSSATLVLSWLVLCHLLADFVLQPEHVAVNKFGRGREAWRALLIHAAIVTVVASPIILVYGVPGIAYVAVTALSHLVIDRTKIMLTLRGGTAGEAADDGVLLIGGGQGPRWSPMPAAWFLLDQLAHLAVLVGVWAIFLRSAESLGWWQDLVTRIANTPDGPAAGRAVLVVIVLTSLVIVNVRAGSLFVDVLVRPPHPSKDEPRPVDAPSEAGIGSTIGIIERLLISALVLAGGVMAIGFVIAAKTLARFKQLDDKYFAEYYLLGTLASVTFAVVTSL